jgi:hypothetical protein
MRPFLWRWRWWLLLGCCLVVLGSVGALLYELLTPDPVRLAFSRVQLGMTESDVQAVLQQDVVTGVEKWPFEGTAVAVEGIEDHTQEFRVFTAWKMKSYKLRSGEIRVDFANGRAAAKYCLRHSSIWDRLPVFLGRIRAAVGL